jgi:hypothetical protein
MSSIAATPVMVFIMSSRAVHAKEGQDNTALDAAICLFTISTKHPQAFGDNLCVDCRSELSKN